MKTYTNKKRNSSSNKTKKHLGGKTFSFSKPVKLKYTLAKKFVENGEEKSVTEEIDVKCSLCGMNNYTETTGTLGKSKVRSGLGSFFFGDIADDFDTTSIIVYTCNTCGLCKVIRNKDPLMIRASEIGS